MYRALITTEAPISPDELRQDLESIGVQVVDSNTDPRRLAQAVVRNTPDVVIAGCRSPSELLFQAAHSLSTLAPCPFVVFTSDADSSKIERASESGIHAYVVEGYSRHRLLSIIQGCRARFSREQLLKNELSNLSQRYEERKQIDRAKGVLMRSRALTEDDAFELLRSLAMNSRQRIGVVALSVIDMSKASEAVNRAGQLRMLSQRIVRFYAQALLDIDAAEALRIIAVCAARAQSNLDHLRKALSCDGYNEHVTRTLSSWEEIATICDQPLNRAHLDLLDQKAAVMLKNADAMTQFLELSGLTASLHAVNSAGRQRMLSQRIAKLCFLLVLEPTGERLQELREATATFRTAMDYLSKIPLATEITKALLQTANVECTRLTEALASLHDLGVVALVAEISETLLEIFDRLTTEYEQAMQILVDTRLGTVR